MLNCADISSRQSQLLQSVFIKGDDERGDLKLCISFVIRIWWGLVYIYI